MTGSTRREGRLVTLAMACSTALCCLGMDVGLPQARVRDLAFSSLGQFEAVRPILIRTREAVYGSYALRRTTADNVLSHIYVADESKTVSVDTPLGTRRVSEAAIHNLRGYFLRSTIPDEQIIIASLQQMRPRQWRLNPHLFQYGNIYIYFVAGVLGVSSKLGFLPLRSDIGFYLDHPEYAARIYSIPKYAGALAFVLSVLAFYWAARRLFPNGWAAVLLTWVYALAPVYILESHILKPYGFCMLPLTLALGYVLRIGKARRAYIFAGIFSGLAAGALIFCAYMVLVLALAHIVLADNRKRWENLPIAGLAFVAAFLAANPYWLVVPGEVIADLRHVQANGVSLWSCSIVKASLGFVRLGSVGIGWPAWLAFTGGSCLVAWRREKRFYPLLVPVLGYLLYTTNKFSNQTPYNQAHYAAAIFPPCLLLAGVAIESALHLGLFLRPARRTALAIAIILPAAAQSVSYVGSFLSEDPRYEAGAWINANIPAGSAIAMADMAASMPVFRYLDYQVRRARSAGRVAPGECYVRHHYPGEAIPEPEPGFLRLARFERRSWMGRFFRPDILWLNGVIMIDKKIT